MLEDESGSVYSTDASHQSGIDRIFWYMHEQVEGKKNAPCVSVRVCRDVGAVVTCRILMSFTKLLRLHLISFGGSCVYFFCDQSIYSYY